MSTYNDHEMFKMRVLVIGWDGASPRLVDRWISDLPTFRRFKEEGVLDEHVPPVPAQTPVAWTTFMTGMNPGKHSIFNFMQRKKGSYERNVISPDLIKGRTLWQILSTYGKRVGAINVPMSTYRGVNGFMIPGFLDFEEGIPQPQSLKMKLEKKFGGMGRFEGDLDIETLRQVKTNPDLFWRRVEEITDRQIEIVSYLLQEEKWDFFMTVFMGTDRIQHFFWKYLDERHPEYEENVYTSKVRDFYKKIDGTISDLIEIVPEDTLIILLSDHGFCSVDKELIVNNYLEEIGMTKIDNGKLDVRQSKAVSYGYGDLWLNVKGREPNGVIEKEDYEKERDKIIEFLEELRVDGEKPIKKVVKREDAYWGPHLEEGPDLIICFNPGWQAIRRVEAVEKRPDKRYVNDNPMWSGGHDGTHDPFDVPGVIGILGPGVLPKEKEAKNRLWDVAPTILKAMNLPIPSDMDGKPIVSFKEN